jgi:hypothetical protein
MALQVNKPISEIVVSAYMADISAASSAYAVAPMRGRVVRAYSVLQGSISAADAVWTMEINGTAISGVSVTVANSGSAAGDVDTSGDIPNSSTNAVNEGDTVEFVSDGASSTTAAAMFYAVIERD